MAVALKEIASPTLTGEVEVEVGDQQFEKRIIETGLSDGINIEVKSGLKEDDKIKKTS